jgi:hypothetical protein
VPEESRSDRVSTTTWWSASADVIGILDLLEDELLGVVEAIRVDGLTEELTRRLGSVSV